MVKKASSRFQGYKYVSFSEKCFYSVNYVFEGYQINKK